MASIAQLNEVAEMCSEYKSESLMSSLDISEISCISCKYWDGEKCSKTGFK